MKIYATPLLSSKIPYLQFQIPNSPNPVLNMASTLHLFQKHSMIEKLSINGKDVWLKVDPYHVKRASLKIIPTEYFTAVYFLQEPSSNSMDGKFIMNNDGEPQLFESPVEALTAARKALEGRM